MAIGADRKEGGSQPQLAVRAVQKLTKSDDVFAILNPFGSGPNAATVKMATDAGVVVFAPGLHDLFEAGLHEQPRGS